MSNSVIITEPGLTSFMLAQRFTPSALQRVCAENGFVPNTDFEYTPYNAKLHAKLKQQALQVYSLSSKTEILQYVSQINK